MATVAGEYHAGPLEAELAAAYQNLGEKGREALANLLPRFALTEGGRSGDLARAYILGPAAAAAKESGLRADARVDRAARATFNGEDASSSPRWFHFLNSDQLPDLAQVTYPPRRPKKREALTFTPHPQPAGPTATRVTEAAAH